MRAVFVMDTACLGMLPMKVVLQYLEMGSLSWKRNVMTATISPEMAVQHRVGLKISTSALVNLPTALCSGPSHLVASIKMVAIVSVCS